MESIGSDCRHVSLANPRGGEHETDLPHLLRRMADLIVESEITENGPWWSATLYWSPDDERPSVERE